MKRDKYYILGGGEFVGRLANRSRKPRRGQRPRRPGALLLARVLALAVALAPPFDGWRTSAQSPACDITQITFTTGEARLGPGLTINVDGTRIAIESFHDLANNNADLNSEIFLFDTDTNSFTQITDSTGPAGTFTNTSPSISADGTRLAFLSVGDYTGENADASGEIFLYDTQTGDFTQVTNFDSVSASFGLGFAEISADGTRIAFHGAVDPPVTTQTSTRKFSFTTRSGTASRKSRAPSADWATSSRQSTPPARASLLSPTAI